MQICKIYILYLNRKDWKDWRGESGCSKKDVLMDRVRKRKPSKKKVLNCAVKGHRKYHWTLEILCKLNLEMEFSTVANKTKYFDHVSAALAEDSIAIYPEESISRKNKTFSRLPLKLCKWGISSGFKKCRLVLWNPRGINGFEW